MAGPTRKPTHLRSIAGTVRPDRPEPAGAEFELLDGVPEPLDWLPNIHAVKEWNRLAPILVANRLLATAHLSTLGHLCALHGKLVQLWLAGETPTGHMLAQYNALAGSFGLSPQWSKKVGVSGNTDTKNSFAKFKKPAG